ncbi:hypothetical protein VOLCADRAFT_87563 [Volvox carteri f. nagariensis]|uniref:Uncharacterized protein n=1 Tax=Volvox carteri f. nagariensis TaxID=3068 RepID=D8TLM4_VOLCA|nr:uncharacterized protein VOLCADRAFT_87563 [Volvox carteri f. nagariensis]EFJ51900.1 hypothetical protein VOLCADRAFT_87563 [Volvox carteri f. nagariensis]|eukprot:XP_002947310.1 hypothetical protein VOLCADRAFT_87563 [Volvox carteri f. nagariensis]
MSRGLVRTAAAGTLLGVSIYVGADVAGEYTTYCALRDQGLAFANQDAALVAQIGTPFEVGPWYNASIGFTQSGHIAAITFPLKGMKQITDVTVRAVRRPGLPSTALYNLLGGEWKVLDCSAMAPQPGGLVRPRSIMPYQAVPKVQDGTVVAVLITILALEECFFDCGTTPSVVQVHTLAQVMFDYRTDG